MFNIKVFATEDYRLAKQQLVGQRNKLRFCKDKYTYHATKTLSTVESELKFFY